MSSEEMFHTDLSDLQGLIRKLNLMDENVNEAVRSSMHKGGSMIKAEQKRLIQGTSKRLADAIGTSRVYVTKKGVIGITSGYQSGAFHTDKDGFNPGLVGVTNEFGRPGQSAQRSSETMEQVRRIIPNRKEGVKRRDWKEAVPTKITVKKGRINPTPHIGRGFQNKLEPALGVVISAIEAEIKKAENG